MKKDHVNQDKTVLLLCMDLQFPFSLREQAGTNHHHKTSSKHQPESLLLILMQRLAAFTFIKTNEV